MREGQRVGEYTLVAKIGAGGMGETWLAARPGLDKKVVIKMILPELAAIPQASQYFSAESKLGARLHHSNIVNLVDRGSGYIVLEYVEGIDLERLLGAHRNLPPEWAVFIASQLCKALSYVHNARIDGQPGEIVHRDVTPDNVFLTCAAEVKLGDFGIAQVKAALRERTAIPGQIKGKYRYLSPEMARGEVVDHRADVFQVGLILYEIVTGTAAFTGTRAGTENIKRGSYRPIQDFVSDVPEPLIEAIGRLMANEPDGRPASAAAAGELVEDACPTFYRAGRSLSEAVMKLADLRASTTFNVPDHLRAMLAEAVATGAPQPSSATVVVQSTPDAKTLPGDEPAQKATPLLPADQAIGVTDSARERAAPVAALASILTVPLRPPVQVAKPRKPAAARRGWLVPLLFLAAVVVVVALAFKSSRQRTVVASIAPAVRLAAPASAPTVPATSPIPPSVASPTPALPSVREPAAPPQAVARLDKPTPHSDVPSETGDEQVGMIEVRKEAQPMRILIDGASFVAPVHYKAEPGPHEVELVRGTAPNEQHAKVTLKVRAGHRYAVNGPHALGGMAASAGAATAAAAAPPVAPSAAPSFGQTYADAQSTYIKNACPAAQTLAHQAMKLAGDAKQHRDAALLFSSAACCAHDAHAVADTWSQLDDSGRGFIDYLCKRAGTQAPKP